MPISRRALLAAFALPRPGRMPGRAILLDLGPDCALQESLAGFRTLVPAVNAPSRSTLLIPGAGRLPQRHSETIRTHLRRGGSVLLESALGLQHPRADAPYFPYVDFTWPVEAKIREFFPLVLQPKPGDRVIATYAGKPVAVRRQAGRGSLILLGSPVGPALLAGDPDARRWLASVLRWMHTHS
ncbi:MAG: hypothetical protein ABSH32_07760 [Bryobacteraceae bacterium]|jgi:hypothetical protein